MIADILPLPTWAPWSLLGAIICYLLAPIVRRPRKDRP